MRVVVGSFGMVIVVASCGGTPSAPATATMPPPQVAPTASSQDAPEPDPTPTSTAIAPVVATTSATAIAPATPGAGGDPPAYDGPWPPPRDASCATPATLAVDAAKRHFKAGLTHFEESDYALAVAEFETAYRLACNAHAMLYNIGKTYELLGKYSKAVAAYKLFLDRDSSVGADRKALVDETIKNLAKKPDLP